VRRRRPCLAACLALAAAALAAAASSGFLGADPAASPGTSDRARQRPPQDGRHRPGGAPAAEVVSAPVRIADAASVRLLHPGDRVDVLAAGAPAGPTGTARVVARAARVTSVPSPWEGDGAGATAAAGEPSTGALVVLAVPRATATALAGAEAASPLAVALC
jgi:Flp pilus assembly protein RcpC/CpaB